jgi:phosphorylcholine metabolism protein LicD
VHCQRNFKQKIIKTELEKNRCKKKNRRSYLFEQNFETVHWNKEIKRLTKKTKFQTRTCTKHETPKKIRKTYAKPKIPKKNKNLKWSQGQGECQGPHLPRPALRPAQALLEQASA